MAMYMAWFVVTKTLIHINLASVSTLSISTLCRSSFLKSNATSPDPLVVCFREVCQKVDSKMKPSTCGSPLFGL